MNIADANNLNWLVVGSGAPFEKLQKILLPSVLTLLVATSYDEPISLIIIPTHNMVIIILVIEEIRRALYCG
jgi:hypothetical protein